MITCRRCKRVSQDGGKTWVWPSERKFSVVSHVSYFVNLCAECLK